MTISYVHGDLLKGNDDVIIHGCNCFNSMGSGIARQIKLVYPGAYQADQETEYGDRSKLGNFTSWIGKHAYNKMYVCVVNAYTQYEYGRDKKNFDEIAFRNACIKIKNEFDKSRSIGFPKIGAGLAKGDWNEIEKIINEVFDDRVVNIYVLE